MYAMSRYPRHPYQTTANSNNTHAHAHHTHQHQQPGLVGPHHHPHLRNPWIAGPQPCESQSTNSSSSSRTYRGGGGGPPWPPPQPQLPPQPYPPEAMLQPASFNHHPRGYADHTVEVMVDGPRAGNTLLLHPGTSSGVAAPTIVRYSTSSRDPSDRERPSSQTSSPGGHSGGGGTVGGCGGHCVAVENFCYYCQRVIFIVGILTGISLTIAGSVLRSQQRGGDLLVLVYIGCLISLVCTLLLAVQCCVRRNVKRRKRTLRSQRDRLGQRRIAQAAAASSGDAVPLQDITGMKVQAQIVANTANRTGPAQQYQPLLMHIVQQQQQTSNTVVSVDGPHIHRPPQHYHHQAHRSGNTTDTSGFVGRMVDVSRSGAPWWRRHAELGPGVAESRH